MDAEGARVAVCGGATVGADDGVTTVQAAARITTAPESAPSRRI